MLRVDNFGWRTTDAKVAVVLGDPGVSVELRSAADNSLAGTYSSGASALDEDSGDDSSRVEF